MAVIEKKFSGVMNLDDNNDVLPSNHHKYANNVVFRGNGNSQIAQSVVGNQLRSNTLPAGTNMCVGAYYDQLNQRVFYFNSNSNGRDGIYIYNTTTKAISTLFLCYTDSATNILEFNVNNPITSINIIYGDAYSSSLDTGGDVLYWVDSLGRPSKINIQRKQQAVYTSYIRSYLDVAKAPPVMPIKCVYENASGVVSQTLLNLEAVPATYTTASAIAFNQLTSTYFGANIDGTLFTYTGSISNSLTINANIYATIDTYNPSSPNVSFTIFKNGSIIHDEVITITSVPTYPLFSANLTSISISSGDQIYFQLSGDATFIVDERSTVVVDGGYQTNAITNNNLKNSLFQFIYRYVYDDNEKSVWSTGSAVPLPYLPYDQSIIADPSRNCRINAFFSTGDETVKKIELAVRRSADGVTSDYGLITSIDKNSASEPLADNTVSNYWFYNSTTLTPIDQAEQVLLFDYVPQKANAQELLNGNTLVYGGITEGYNAITNINADINVSQTQTFTDIPGVLFFAQQRGYASAGGGNSVDVWLTGAGTNGTTGWATTIDNGNGASFIVRIKRAGTTYSLTYTSGTSSISTILAGIASAATSNGFTASYSGNKLTISHASELVLESAYAYTTLTAVPFDTEYVNNVLYTNQNASNYKYGIVYYDDKGRTNGVATSAGLKVTTPSWSADNFFPSVQISINNTPPDWASYYHVVRTDNLTYDKSLFWVSNRAFVKTATYANSSNEFSVVYIGIGNMSYYNEQIQATSGYINYDYAPGDRIRFIQRIAANGTKTSLAGTSYDFEIIGTEINPNISGYVAEGNYIKIKYPTNFINSDFSFYGPDPVVYASSGVGVENYQNYEIQIYSYKKPVGQNEVYYEIGQQYAIAGTIGSRYHVGQVQSQVLNTSPAIINLTQGDAFFRFRNVPIGASYSFAAGPYQQNTGSGFLGQFCTVLINVWDSANNPKTITTSQYEIKSQVAPASTCGLAAPLYPNSATADAIFRNTSGGTMTIRVRGTLVASTNVSRSQYVVMHAKVVTTSGASVYTIVPRGNIGTTNDEYSFPFDANIVVPNTAKVFLITECQNANANSLMVGAFNFQLDVVKNAQIGVIESSFSDVFKLELNPQSRPVIYDENAKNAYYPTLVRWSLPKNVGTLINQTNRFYPSNMDEYDRQKGDIRRFKVRGSQMRVFQSRGCGMCGVLENMIFNAGGEEQLIQTNKILNQIHYYQGEYGIGWLSTSLASSAGADYFVDPVRGYQVRLSADGITPISELYKAQYYMTELSTKYVYPQGGTLGGYAKVLGVYNFFEEEYVSVFQAYGSQPNTTLAFNEYRNCYTSFYSYAPEWMVSAEGTLISFRNGNLYTHDNTTNYSTFYGTLNNPNITFVFNDQGMLKKDFNAITQDSNYLWTSSNNTQISTSLGQNSNLVSSDYVRYEGLYNAAFMRDANSIGGVVDGDYLKGTWLQINMNTTVSNLVYLSGLYINYTVSQRNG